MPQYLRDPWWLTWRAFIGARRNNILSELLDLASHKKVTGWEPHPIYATQRKEWYVDTPHVLYIALALTRLGKKLEKNGCSHEALLEFAKSGAMQSLWYFTRKISALDWDLEVTDEETMRCERYQRIREYEHSNPIIREYRAMRKESARGPDPNPRWCFRKLNRQVTNTKQARIAKVESWLDAGAFPAAEGEGLEELIGKVPGDEWPRRNPHESTKPWVLSKEEHEREPTDLFTSGGADMLVDVAQALSDNEDEDWKRQDEGSSVFTDSQESETAFIQPTVQCGINLILRDDLKQGDILPGAVVVMAGEGTLLNQPTSLAHTLSAVVHMYVGLPYHFDFEFRCDQAIFDQIAGQPLGGIAVTEITDKKDESRHFAYHLITKLRHHNRTTLKLLTSAIEKMRDHAVEHDVRTISIPKLGCAWDGLPWHRVRGVLHDNFVGTGIVIRVYPELDQ